MYYRDYDPAHYHAIYGEFEIPVTLEDEVVQGHLPEAGPQASSSLVGAAL